jgi:hypothetical protein
MCPYKISFNDQTVVTFAGLVKKEITPGEEISSAIKS